MQRAKLGSILRKYIDYTTHIQSKDIQPTGRFPVVAQDTGELIKGFTNNNNPIREIPVIVFGDHSCTLKYVDFPFFRGADGTQLLYLNNSYDTKFIYYWLSVVISQIPNYGKYERHIKYVKQLDISTIPLLPTQQKIAGVLSALDDKIALNKRESARLEVLARAIYDYWFVQFDFPDSEGKPYKASGGQMVLSEELKREIPAGWEVKKLGEILNFQKGTEPGAKSYLDTREENTVPFYRVGDIDSQPSIFIKYNCDLKIAKIGDILVTFDGSVGKMGIDIEGAYSSGLQKIFDPSNKIGNATVWAIFLDSRIKATIEKYATGSVLKHASSSIPHLIIPYNPEIFTAFNVQVKPLFDKIQHNAIESRKLAALRDELLPLLMNGQALVE